ncbi:MAG: hypothetical protein ACOY71_02945 [Gemmatimonadota bacterium]
MRILFCAALCGAALACGDGTGPASPPGTAPVSLSIGTGATIQGAPGPALASERFTLGGTTLVIDSVQIVLRDIELKPDDGFDCHAGLAPALSESKDGHEGRDSQDSAKRCHEFETGPVLLSLPLGGGVQRAFTIDVPAGTYHDVEFELHKPAGEDDRPFLVANPDFFDTSVRVKGTFNGQPFTYLGDITAEQELALVPPLEVKEGVPVNLSLMVDLSTWFLDRGGANFIDPRTANRGGPNQGLVTQNIKASLRVFEDDDRDGRQQGSSGP